MAKRTSAGPNLTSRDSTYFLTSVIFQVEDTLFQVPRYHFERNEVFSTAFQLPHPPGQEAEGASEQTPIQLPINKDDFKAFLSILYPLTISIQDNFIPVEDWISALKISDMYGFDSIRELAIRKLSTPDKLDPAPKITLGIEYNVGQWVLSGCEELITRDNGPRADEAMGLGEDITTMIWDLREEVHRGGYGHFRLRAIVDAFESGCYAVTFDEQEWD